MSNLINEEQYKEITQQGNVAIQFTADWCGPCKNLKNVMKKTTDTFNVDYKLVNIENSKTLSESKKIRSIPYVELYKNGEIVHSFVGQKTPSQINDIFESFYN